MAGAAIRILPGPHVFRILVATLLLPLGAWPCLRTLRPARRRTDAAEPSARVLAALAMTVGVVGGIYGIGGGTLLEPILAARGMPMASIAPATLVATFTTFVAAAAVYAALGLARPGPVAPDWWLVL
ncbi:TSUP family transporter [Streptomyces sp. SP18CS02]|uniref:TSUP family transporter n=1 Tax=Streptomyces sp. SP18CS02 TaxID=3002531 RepID=UPI002E76C95F|nr:TSUP family transporter [Streptomyces sp. SP18CS02]